MQSGNSSVKRVVGLLLLLICLSPGVNAQYTEVINSNRPGLAVSAYALGSNVLQAEIGGFYEIQDHSLLNTESSIIGSDFALRYGLYFETLEVTYEGTFIRQDIQFNALGGQSDVRSNFTRNRLGLKLLVFDPYKNPKRSKPNLYSWRKNNLFQWKNLIPAVSLYGGANFTIGDNPFYPEDPLLSYRAMVATQSRLTPKMVLIGNFAYDRISTDFPEYSYLVSISHSLRNPRWSIFVENQGIQSDRYADVLFRTGFAHLFNADFQVDFNIGASIKTTPSRYFASAGMSYRIDRHRDRLVKKKEASPTSNKRIKKRGSRKKRNKARKSDF